jgi:mono/diheme cytochrome c family protein
LTGQEAFAALCAPCHGAQGQGSPLGPELQHPVAGFSTWVVRNGRATTVYPAPMAVFDAPAINEAQLDEIWAWLDGLPNPTTGQALYDDYCANCHGADALGGRVGKDIEDKQLADVQEKVREGEGGNGYANTTGYMPRWSVGQLSDEELTLIANYIASL